ncbi:choline-sulfatase [Dongia sp. agr-C8]
MGRPNILFVMFDQMAALSLPVYGHPLVRMPNLERLAGRGTLFENAYCNAPLCSPARFALMTGRYPSAIGAFDNAAELPSDQPTWAHHLRALGYRTCLSGKMDFTGADQLHGYEERLTTDLSPSDFGWVPDWERRDEILSWSHSMASVAEAGPCDYTLNMEYDEDACFKAIQWLHRRGGAADERPFALTVSFMHPHDPYQAPRQFWDWYEGAPIDAPQDDGQPVVARDVFGQRMYRLYDRGEIPVDAKQVLCARRAYYGMLSYCDALLGRLLERLDLLGLTENTVVVVSSDHGDMLGERGLWYKMVFFERAIRVPLVFAGPGIPAGHRVADPVSHLDLLPSFTAIAGDEVARDGRSLLPLLQGESGGAREVVGQYMGEGYDHPLIMLRRENWKFIHSEAEGSFLYDLAKDPMERQNIADGEQGRALRDEVRRRWDLAGLRAAVMASQRRRRLIHAALTQGRIMPWDFERREDAAGSYWRNYGDNRPDPDRALRLPRVQP